MLTNATLAVSIENANGFVNESSEQALEDQKNGLRLKQQTFFGIILWSTFGLAMVRFVGVSIRGLFWESRILSLIFSVCITSSTAIFSAGAEGIRRF